MSTHIINTETTTFRAESFSTRSKMSDEISVMESTPPRQNPRERVTLLEMLRSEPPFPVERVEPRADPQPPQALAAAPEPAEGSTSSFWKTLLDVVIFRRPEIIASPDALQEFHDELNKRISGRSGANCYNTISIAPGAIPDKISYERMMAGQTYPPLSKSQFFKFLNTMDRNVENLAFVICVEHYEQLFKAVSEEYKAALSAEWTQSDEANARRQILEGNIKRASLQVDAIVVRNSSVKHKATMPTPPHSSEGVVDAIRPTSPDTNDQGEYREDMSLIAPFAKRGTRDSAGPSAVKEQSPIIAPRLPIAVENLWKEAEHIKATYIDQGSEHALNLSSKERELVLHALNKSNHPTAFRTAVDVANNVLRNDSYPKFIQSVTPNSNPIRIHFAYFTGGCLAGLGFVVPFVLAMGPLHRAWRIITIPPAIVGVATLYGALHGMCLVIHSLGHYQVKPWDVFDHEDEDRSRVNPQKFLGGKYKDEAQGWVQRYNRRYAIRKIFDKEAPIQCPVIRQGQNVIFCQGLFLGFMVAMVVTAFFLAIPPGGVYGMPESDA